MNINFKKISPKTPFLKKHRREILIGFCALLVLLVRFIFPAKMNGELFWLNLFIFLFFPWIVIRFLLKENLDSFGISWGDHKKGIALSVVFVAVFGLINYFIVHKPGLRSQLQISPDIVKNFWIFLWFQLVISLASHFSWEFFFRGFLQMGLEKKIGNYSVLLQAIAQTLFFARSSWVILFLVGSSSLAAGAITWKSRSIFYSFVSMWLISLSLDIMIIRYIHYGVI